jgi:hypothetical protein
VRYIRISSIRFNTVIRKEITLRKYPNGRRRKFLLVPSWHISATCNDKQDFSMAQQALNIVSAVFSLCAMVFFIVGCIGYSDKMSDIKHTAWIKADGAWVGLSKLVANFGGGGDQAIHFKDCDASFCDTCDRDGESAFGLIVVATIFAFLSTILSGALSAGHRFALQWAAVFVAFVSALFAIIGFGLFMGQCYKKIDDSNDGDLHWGPGSILTCLGLLMMFVVVVLHLVALIVGPKVDA